MIVADRDLQSGLITVLIHGRSIKLTPAEAQQLLAFLSHLIG